ncbi:MAG: DEAD/DEAH box helicase family protein [Thermoguttaceae bacterium]|nr:DEAD/DEAH box helicase family protein [Thermoguttaceae bacterium]
MKSINFEFLRPNWPELASLGGFAEGYAHTDPSSALVKLRAFVEQLVESVYQRLALPRPIQPNLIDLLREDAFRQAVPSVVVDTMHAVRIEGNKAAHGAEARPETALWLLKESHRLGQWLYMSLTGAAANDVPTYQEPAPGAPGDKSKGELKREKKAILERLASQEARMQKILDDLAAARQSAVQAKASEEELRARLQAAQHVASVLDFSEAETRKHLIDTQLADAGWDMGHGQCSIRQVGREVEIAHQPTETGIGFADYVLYDDNDAPLAVVEAKKTAKDPEEGRTQAKCYADGLEKEHGRRPVIFYTNGFDIWIWDDAAHWPPRKVYGFYSKDSLQFMVKQRASSTALSQIIPKEEIVNRLYQIEAVTQALERFQNRRRKALIVLATGTGKTRVAIAVAEALFRAGWVKRVLFLCDRRELRKQAHNAFKQHLPNAGRVYVTAQTQQQREHRIYLATYPAMMKCFQTFDPGFFDLIIADESHRSIYNRYRDLLHYFDALQVGLTATPRKDLITHNTYELFGCEDNDPTAYYSYDQAVADEHLTPFEVQTFTTPFLREGIKYGQMSVEQRQQLEENEIEPDAIEFEQRQVDKHIYNKDTNRRILRNLMDSGIKVDDGSRLGKSIIFARNHNHAVLLERLFEEMYPQYGGDFCRVIDNYDPRAEALIDDLKGEGNNPELTIAISVDMLDTGIDVPEIVNLVFAKPVYSYVKFWQMIGRGTRLCENLFGPGKDKKKFLIFDHWGNFEFFEEQYTEPEATPGKSIQQVLFEDRIRLAEAAVAAQDTGAFDLACDLLLADVRALDDHTIAVRDKWREVKTLQQDGAIKQFDAATKSMLKTVIAPLMQWRNIAGHVPACQFDALCCRLQTGLLTGASGTENLRDELINRVVGLQVNLNPVRAKLPVIEKVKRGPFWTAPTVADLEQVRRELRGVIHYQGEGGPGGRPRQPKVIDVTEDDGQIETARYRPKLQGLELIEYRNRVQQVLTSLIDSTPALQKIKAGQPVSGEELDKVASLVLAQAPDLDLRDLLEYYPETAGNLAVAIRGIIGLDARAVTERFTAFARAHKLNSTQLRFLDLLKNHIRDYGAIEVDQLYELPFTVLDKDGLDGVFPDGHVADELVALVESFATPPTAAPDQTA